MFREYSEVREEKIPVFNETVLVLYRLRYIASIKYPNVIKRMIIEIRQMNEYKETVNVYDSYIYRIDYIDAEIMKVSVYEVKKTYPYEINETRELGGRLGMIRMGIEDDPWFLRVDMLENEIKKHGVRDTIKKVLSSIRSEIESTFLLPPRECEEKEKTETEKTEKKPEAESTEKKSE